MPAMIETGKVTEVREDGVDVRMDAGVGSDVGCAHCNHCTTASGELLMCDVADPLGVKAGDRVAVQLPAGSRLFASVVSYGLPVVALPAGYLAGFLLAGAFGWNGDDVGALTAVAAAAVTFVLARGISARALSGGRFRPRVHAIIASSEEHDATGRTGGTDTRA